MKPLTPEGRRVLDLAERGLHERAIARRLGVTVRRVRLHIGAARERRGRIESSEEARR